MTAHTQDMMARIDAMFASRAKPVQPISAEQAAKTRAALDAKFREGVTVQARDNRGCFLRGAKVATFGGAAPVEAVDTIQAEEIDEFWSEEEARLSRQIEAAAVEPAFKIAAE